MSQGVSASSTLKLVDGSWGSTSYTSTGSATPGIVVNCRILQVCFFTVLLAFTHLHRVFFVVCALVLR
jgi:hypothetical protein